MESSMEVMWRCIIRFDRDLTNEMWDAVHVTLKIPLAYEVAARLIATATQMRRYRQTREYQCLPIGGAFSGIPMLDKE